MIIVVILHPLSISQDDIADKQILIQVGFGSTEDLLVRYHNTFILGVRKYPTGGILVRYSMIMEKPEDT